jgi:hypothetical protein
VNNPVPPPDGTYPPPRQGQFPAQREGGYQAEAQGGWGGYPAPAQPGYPDPRYAQPEFPGPGAAQTGQGQVPYSAQGQPPYLPPEQGQAPHPHPGEGQPGFAGAMPPAPPGEGKKKGGARRVIVRVALVVLALAVVGGARFALMGGGDHAQDAKTGDCIASDEEVSPGGNTKTGAKIVDCGSSEAKFTVVARVNGESDVESKACDKLFKPNEHFYRYATDSGAGYLLCLRPKA